MFILAKPTTFNSASMIPPRSWLRRCLTNNLRRKEASWSRNRIITEFCFHAMSSFYENPFQDISPSREIQQIESVSKLFMSKYMSRWKLPSFSIPLPVLFCCDMASSWRLPFTIPLFWIWLRNKPLYAWYNLWHMKSVFFLRDSEERLQNFTKQYLQKTHDWGLFSSLLHFLGFINDQRNLSFYSSFHLLQRLGKPSASIIHHGNHETKTRIFFATGQGGPLLLYVVWDLGRWLWGVGFGIYFFDLYGAWRIWEA